MITKKNRHISDGLVSNYDFTTNTFDEFVKLEALSSEYNLDDNRFPTAKYENIAKEILGISANGHDWGWADLFLETEGEHKGNIYAIADITSDNQTYVKTVFDGDFINTDYVDLIGNLVINIENQDKNDDVYYYELPNDALVSFDILNGDVMKNAVITSIDDLKDDLDYQKQDNVTAVYVDDRYKDIVGEYITID